MSSLTFTKLVIGLCEILMLWLRRCRDSMPERPLVGCVGVSMGVVRDDGVRWVNPSGWNDKMWVVGLCWVNKLIGYWLEKKSVKAGFLLRTFARPNWLIHFTEPYSAYRVTEFMDTVQKFTIQPNQQRKVLSFGSSSSTQACFQLPSTIDTHQCMGVLIINYQVAALSE